MSSIEVCPYGSSLVVGWIWWTTLDKWWWWWWSGRRDSPSNGGSRGKWRGNGKPPGNPANPPSNAVAVLCSCALRRNSARLLLRWRSPLPGLQQPHSDPGQPAGVVHDSISCRLLGRWSLVVHNDGVADVSDVDAVEPIILLLPNSGGENWAAKWGEKNNDVGGSNGLNPAVELKPEKLLIIIQSRYHGKQFTKWFLKLRIMNLHSQ